MTYDSSLTLTFVLAVKDPDEFEFAACTASMAALKCANRLDLVIVSSGTVPALSESVRKRLHDVRIVQQEPIGVYSAYNKGLEDLKTDYVMVIGGDDLVLPGLDTLLDSVPANGKPHLVAACSLMQGKGISRPSTRRWGLIFRNWCQQGLLYRTDIFLDKRFDTKYKIQADHKFNMELASDPAITIYYSPEVISHFSSNGLSQTESDWQFRKDMPEIVKSCYGSLFWLVALLKRKVADVVKGYDVKKIYNQDK